LTKGKSCVKICGTYDAEQASQIVFAQRAAGAENAVESLDAYRLRPIIININE